VEVVGGSESESEGGGERSKSECEREGDEDVPCASDPLPKGFYCASEDADDFTGEGYARLNHRFREPVFEPAIATSGLLSGAAGDNQELHIFFAAATAITFLNVRGD